MAPQGDIAMEMTVEDAVVVLRRKLGANTFVICVLGTTSPLPDEPDLPALARAVGRSLSAASFEAGQQVAFVTAGMSGVQEVFAHNCNSAKLWNLLPQGQRSGYGAGQDINVGVNNEHRNSVITQLGDAYVTIGGGPDVAKIALAVNARRTGRSAACIVPLGRSGGASSGMFGFPHFALNRPFFSSREAWAHIFDVAAPEARSADAVVTILQDYLRWRDLPDGPTGAVPVHSTQSAALATMRAKMGQDSVEAGNAQLEQWVTGYYRSRAEVWPIHPRGAADLSGERHKDMWSPGLQYWRRNKLRGGPVNVVVP